MPFELKAPYKATGDQPAAITQLVHDVNAGKEHNTLLGVTGSGKTFTMANVIAQTQKPTLVIAHNKTLAAQLYQEFRDFFPNNAVSYFVSYYDYYQPEAYIPTTDTYIEKEATINDEIDKLRLAATTNLLTRKDVIVVASVSCIYNLGSPVEYGKRQLELIEGEIISRETLLLQLANLQYERSDMDLQRGTYRLRGDSIQLWPAYENKALRIDTLENTITTIKWIDPISGKVVLPPKTELSPENPEQTKSKRFTIYPAKHFMMNEDAQPKGIKDIERDLALRLAELKDQGKTIEAYRLKQKVEYDLNMMTELGYVNGIENYSRYFDGRAPGDPPFTLIDYFRENIKQFGQESFLTLVDESHITLPQVRGMFNGDRARKETLIEYGFRLPSALDNRPLRFEEFQSKTQQMLYVSATPQDYELSLSEKPVEQLIRPTGLLDPQVELRPTEGQIEDLVIEILQRKKIGQRTIVTTLTKKMAEALTDYLNNQEKIDGLVESYQEKQKAKEEKPDPEKTFWQEELLPVDEMGIGPIDEKYYYHLQHTQPHQKLTEYEYPNVAYLHSDIETLERSDILDDLRRGEYDVVVGINLLREGLDLPEVSLVAILDADKEGFLRSDTSLIQTIGRAARHEAGISILYADKLTGSMQRAVGETNRRRTIQDEFNQKHGITPTGISKPVRERMIQKKEEDPAQRVQDEIDQANQPFYVQLNKSEQIDLNAINAEDLTPRDKQKLAAKLTRRMNTAAKDMDFELAAELRDVIKSLE